MDNSELYNFESCGERYVGVFEKVKSTVKKDIFTFYNNTNIINKLIKKIVSIKKKVFKSR